MSDESGHAVVGAQVQAIAKLKRWAGAFYEAPVGRADESDDRGHFRLHSLPPGRYTVAVSLPAQTSSASSESGYVRTYHPGTTSLADAHVVSVEANRERLAAVRIRPVRFMEVTGVVTTSDGQPAGQFSVWLRGGPATIGYTGVDTGFRTTMVASATSAENGSFSLTRVPAGAYTLSITNGYTRRGRPLEILETPIHLTEAPPARVEVRTARGATVSGRVQWAGKGPAPWPRNGSLGRLRATGIGRDSDFAAIDAAIQPDGTFTFTDMYGLRRIQAMTLPMQWAIESVEGPKGTMAGPNLNVRPGVDISDVTVVVTNRTGTLRIVTDGAGAPHLRGSVLLMPRDPSDIDALGWGFRATQGNATAGGGEWYTMDAILPGSYLLAAVDVEPYRLSADADLMERARAAAVRVDIGEGDTTARLRVVSLRPFVRTPK